MTGLNADRSDFERSRPIVLHMKPRWHPSVWGGYLVGRVRNRRARRRADELFVGAAIEAQIAQNRAMIDRLNAERGESWEPPRCSHGRILLGCPHDDCPEQTAYLATQTAALDQYEARLNDWARRYPWP